jgi:hypothetical protein
MTFISKDLKVSSFMLVFFLFLDLRNPLTNCTTCRNHKYFCQRHKKFKPIRKFWVIGLTLHIVTFHLQEDVGMSKKQNVYSFENQRLTRSSISLFKMLALHFSPFFSRDTHLYHGNKWGKKSHMFYASQFPQSGAYLKLNTL